eukprot:1667274-Rhodomonas_salina.1
MPGMVSAPIMIPSSTKGSFQTSKSQPKRRSSCHESGGTKTKIGIPFSHRAGRLRGLTVSFEGRPSLRLPGYLGYPGFP